MAPDRPAPDDDRIRYFVLCTGRSGSTLLAAILADAGAAFGLEVPDDWDPDSGELEHGLVQECSRLFRRASYIQAGKRYFLVYKYMIDFYRSQGKKRLRRALREARYVKADSIDLWIWHVLKMGYAPRVIVSYRDFAANARSFYLMTGLRLPEFAAYYRRVNGNALMMLGTFGGCAVATEELADPAATGWADALSQATGLDRAALLAARDRRVRRARTDGGGNAPEVPLHDEAAERLYHDLRALSGVYVPPSAQIRRRTAARPAER